MERLLACLGAARDLLHILHAQQRLASAVAREHLHYLSLGVLAREAEAHELVGRQRSGTFRRDRTLAVERVVHVNHLALMVSRDTDAAAEVSHYEVHLLILATYAARIAARSSLGVERVEYRLALHERQTRVAGACHELVYHHRVGHVSRTVAHLRYIVGDERTEIAHVLVLGVDEVLLHLLVDGVDTTVQRLQQTAATYHGVELQRYSSLLEQLQHEVLAILILLVNGSEMVQLLLRMQSVRCPYSTFVFIHSHLR